MNAISRMTVPLGDEGPVIYGRVDSLAVARGQAAGEIEVCPESATRRRAAAKCSGNVLPRFFARRRIPRQALALKKYRRGTSPVSKMSDNEHATAPLWNSEVLSVKNSVGEPIPEFPQR